MQGSVPPPGRPVDGGPLLPHADATRSVHFQRLLRDGTAAKLGVGGLGATVLFALVEWDPGAALFGFVAMPFVVLLLLVVMADGRAAADFFASYAAARGLTHALEGELMPLTPLLSAGDRRGAQHVMEGRLAGSSRAATVAHYTFEVRNRLPSGSDGGDHEPYHFTVCLVDVPQAFPRFRGVYLRPALPALTPDWLKGGGRREIELESVEFHRSYRLSASAEQDEGAVRELFAPALVVELVDDRVSPGLELGAGGLCVYVPGRLEDRAGLDAFLATASRLLGHVEREIAEAALTPA